MSFQKRQPAGSAGSWGRRTFGKEAGKAEGMQRVAARSGGLLNSSRSAAGGLDVQQARLALGWIEYRHEGEVVLSLHRA